LRLDVAEAKRSVGEGEGAENRHRVDLAQQVQQVGHGLFDALALCGVERLAERGGLLAREPG
jgi:hypothetical protein